MGSAAFAFDDGVFKLVAAKPMIIAIEAIMPIIIILFILLLLAILLLLFSRFFSYALTKLIYFDMCLYRK